MANFEVLSLDPTTPQIRAPGAGDGYSVPRDMTFATGTTLNAPTTVVSVNTSTDALRITQVGSGNALVVEDSANPDATPTVITAAGDVGIGTASPTQLVQAKKDQAAYTWMRVENNSSNASAYAGLAIGAFGNSWGWTVGSTAANSNALNLVVDAGGSNSSIATFSTSGNVGIGTTSPSTRLNVVGGISRFQGSGNAGRIEVFDSDNSNQSRILINPAYNSLEPAIQVTTNTPLLFVTNNTERARITAAGELLVGGTTSVQAAAGVITAQTSGGGYFNSFRNDTSIVTGNDFGGLWWYGNDTTSNTPTAHAWVQAVASGDHAAGDNPTDIAFATTPDGTATVAEAGRITQAGSYVLKGGTTTAAAGVGIIFPATQVASANANSLDDYEEGAWTPVVADAATGGNASATVCVGSYTKVGRVVTATCAAPNIDTTGLTAGNDVFIRGLPFTAFDIPSATTFYTGVAFTSNVTIVAPPVVYVQDITTYAKLFDSGAILVSDITSGLGDIYFTITYQAA